MNAPETTLVPVTCSIALPLLCSVSVCASTAVAVAGTLKLRLAGTTLTDACACAVPLPAKATSGGAVPDAATCNSPARAPTAAG